MPLVLAGIHTTIRRHYLWGFALTSLGLALEIDSNHPQITYYLLLLVIFYGISALVFAIREQQLKPFLTSAVVLVVAALLAVGANLGRLWTTAEYSAYSTRGSSELTAAPTLVSETDAVNADRDYVFQWSTRKLEAFTLLIPNFFGGGAQDVGMGFRTGRSTGRQRSAPSAGATIHRECADLLGRQTLHVGAGLRGGYYLLFVCAGLFHRG